MAINLINPRSSGVHHMGEMPEITDDMEDHKKKHLNTGHVRQSGPNITL